MERNYIPSEVCEYGVDWCDEDHLCADHQAKLIDEARDSYEELKAKEERII